MSSLPLMEQLYIFHKAKVIITSHGAALVNILACNKECKIIEIATEKMSNLKHFEDIAITLNLNYTKFLDVTELNSHHDLYEANMLLNADSIYKLFIIINTTSYSFS
jgi:capsular polysaccharide biosynthesis protein